MKSTKLAIQVVAAALALASASSEAQDNTINFRGLPFGTTESELVTKLPYFSCRGAPNKEAADRVCTADTNSDEAMLYANQRAKQIELGFIANELVTINVRFEFPTVSAMRAAEGAILQVLVSRYGAPIPKTDAEKRSTMPFSGWNLADGGTVLSASSASGLTAPSYTISYSSPKYWDAVKQRQLPRLKEQSKGM